VTDQQLGVDRAAWRALEAGVAQGDWTAALSESRRLLVAYPDSAAVAVAMGICQFHQRKFVDCIEWMNRADRLYKRVGYDATRPLPAVFLFRGLAYAAQRFPAAARADLEQLRGYGPAPIAWDRMSSVLRGDELLRARYAAEDSGLMSAQQGGQ
jgi:hypothetical protein